VYGIEADLNWVGAKDSTFTHNSFPFTTKLSWLGTVRGRLGITLSPPTLLYATGGYAVGKVENDTTDLGGFTDHRTRSGWTVGGGIEHMFTPQWTVKAEALYVDFGTSDVQGYLGSAYSADFKDTAVIARVGANFKF
jgi:outer membrane immunogenic protein